MRNTLLAALRHPSSEPNEAGLEAVAESAPSYGLDDTADADIGKVELEDLELLEEGLDEDPDAVLGQARSFWDADLTETELREALGRARGLLAGEGVAEKMLESNFQFIETFRMPADYDFEGYDPQRLPVFPMEERFETRSDAVGYALAFAAAKSQTALKKKAPFRWHGSGRSFVYDMPATRTCVALLADFGNGLAHSRYIAKHIQALKPAHLVYLGDVYYAGTSSEFRTFVAPHLEPMLGGTAVTMLNSNHEMFSKGYPYFSYLEYRRTKGAPQVQEGSYFCLRFGDAFQIVGIDTDYFGHRRFHDAKQRAWLGEVLREGRNRGAINVLVSANEPFEYGKAASNSLLFDLAPFLPFVDLWFWGNTHYCGVFDRSGPYPVTSCIGHGGYPYRLKEYALHENPYGAPCPAPPLFLETQPRYRGTNLRPELGNNGYCVMYLEPQDRRIRLEYVDWTRRPRYRAELGERDGRVSVLRGEEMF